MPPPTRNWNRMVYGISLAVLGVYAAFGQRIHPSVAFLTPLRIDLIALTALAGLTFVVRSWGPSVVVGGLLGAAFVAPWAAAPWLVAPALAIAWAGKRRGMDLGGSGLAIVFLAAVINSGVVAGATYQGLRISPEDFAEQDFRVSRLLADVPLHDAWAIDLEGRPTPTLEDLGVAFRGFSLFQITPAISGLGILREVVGFALEWEDPRWSDAKASFVHRVPETDRRRSTTDPGTTFGIWTVLYACPEEGAIETINGTAQVAVAATIGEGPDGPRLFLSFRVREVNWTTPFYMRLIDPSRRFFVYPFLLRQFAHLWQRGQWDRHQEISTGEEQ